MHPVRHPERSIQNCRHLVAVYPVAYNIDKTQAEPCSDHLQVHPFV